jgi:hypothetical protein
MRCWLQSREGRLRCDRVVAVVCDILTADHDRIEPTCGVAFASADAGKHIAGGVLEAGADTGVRAAGAVLKSAADAVACTRPSAISTAATDACKLATGGVLDAGANTCEKTASGVVKSATDACPETCNCVSLACDETAESQLSEPITVPDDQVV